MKNTHGTKQSNNLAIDDFMLSIIGEDVETKEVVETKKVETKEVVETKKVETKIKHKLNYGKGVICKNKKDTFANIGLIQHQIEFSKSEYLFISGIAKILCDGQSVSAGSINELKHDDIKWDRLDNEKYHYETIDNKLYKIGRYKKEIKLTKSKTEKTVLFYDADGNKELIKYKEPQLVINYRKKDVNFDKTQILYFDFDDGITIKQSINIAKKNDMDIALLYPTFSHLTKKDVNNEYIEKFRLLHVLPFLITDTRTYPILGNKRL